jgi:predicted small integral membrane protein
MNLTDFDPDYVFSHHSATPEKLKQYEAIHESAKQFARVILENVPASSDRMGAIQLLREASMLACAAISLDGRLNA